MSYGKFENILKHCSKKLNSTIYKTINDVLNKNRAT